MLGVAALAVAVVALSPLLYLGLRALEDGPARAWELLTAGRTAQLVVRSVGLTVTVTALCLLIGTVAAWLVVRTDLPGRSRWAVLLTVPLAIPSYVAGYLWISEAPQLAGFTGATLVLTLSSYPYVLLPVAAALLTADPALADVSRTLGRSSLRTTVTVVGRQVWPAAAAGGLLVALYVLSDFGAVALMRYETFTTGIYASYRGSFSRVPAAVLSVVLVALALGVTLAERRVRRGATHRVGAGAGGRAAPVALGRARPVALAGVVVVVGLGVVAPLAALAQWLVRAAALELDVGRVLSALASTAQLATAAAVVVTLCALPVGLLAARSGGRLARGAELSTYVGHALPGITVGLALVFLGIRLLPGWYQQTPLLVLGYVVLFLPLAVGSTRAAVAASSSRLEDTAATLGSGRTMTSLRVTLPIAAPGVLVGAALVFLTVAKELPATLLLRPTATNTLATELWTQTTTLAYSTAAPYALALIALSALPALVLTRLTARLR